MPRKVSVYGSRFKLLKQKSSKAEILVYSVRIGVVVILGSNQGGTKEGAFSGHGRALLPWRLSEYVGVKILPTMILMICIYLCMYTPLQLKIYLNVYFKTLRWQLNLYKRMSNFKAIHIFL